MSTRKHEQDAPIYHDADKLYSQLWCQQCWKATRHIFCMSIKNQGFLYACMSCSSERVPEKPKKQGKPGPKPKTA